ncbi:hypothetical protein EU545_05425 [Candidatus Thorarchaeota archaeon]|nr:MAG: hypothetical protein EU545_05425 [Candidatus Thorarchaeota archaeon]
MFRTIIALLITLAVTIIIGVFQIVGLGIEGILAIAQSPDAVQQAINIFTELFAELVLPYSSALGGIYAPLVALGVGGFIGGLVSKSGVRMFFASIIGLVVFFIGYAVLAGGAALTIDDLLAQAQLIYIDLGVSFALLFVPGIIGASLTAEEY